jgi:hypothetical protein
MRVRTILITSALAAVALTLPAAAGAAGRGGPQTARGANLALHADATCHDPCDDPFRLVALVHEASGAPVGGVKIAFEYATATKTVTKYARTDSGGRAHVHVKLSPSIAPGGDRIDVTVKARAGGVPMKSTTWFVPNYS